MGFLDEPAKEEAPQEESVEKIKVGDLEFAPEELQDIVGKYKQFDEKAKDMGGVDNVFKYAGNLSNELGKVREELEAERQAKAAANKEPSPTGEPSPEEVIKAAEEQGFITKQNLNTYLAQYRAAEKLVDEVKAMEEKGNPYDAKELPPFVATEMLDYMTETGIKNPRSAYNDKYEKEIDAWKQKTLTSSRPKGMVTEERVSGNKQPAPVKIDRSNLTQAIGAALNGEI